jgi:NAD(P)-dependent dehydrogenase (short-subunit alcohol dehydrogenase family)
MNIQNSIALVTGANRGAGKAYVAELLRRGVTKVYAGARNLDSLADTVALDPSRVGRHALDQQCGRAQFRWSA